MSVTSTDTWLMLAPLSVAADAGDAPPAPASSASAPISSRRDSDPRSKRVTRSAMMGSTIPPKVSGPRPKVGCSLRRMKRNWAAAVVVSVLYVGHGVFTQKPPAPPGPVTAAQYERSRGLLGKDT